jgi:hypothetical protein
MQGFGTCMVTVCHRPSLDAAVLRIFVADVPTRVICFFLGIGASGCKQSIKCGVHTLPTVRMCSDAGVNFDDSMPLT